MAIEIIKKGTKPEDRVVQGTCSSCLSSLRWKASDGKHGSCQREGEWNTVRCPVCGSDVMGTYQVRDDR